jgi:hypothetical protein
LSAAALTLIAQGFFMMKVGDLVNNYKPTTPEDPQEEELDTVRFLLFLGVVGGIELCFAVIFVFSFSLSLFSSSSQKQLPAPPDLCFAVCSIAFSGRNTDPVFIFTLPSRHHSTTAQPGSAGTFTGAGTWSVYVHEILRSHLPTS